MQNIVDDEWSNFLKFQHLNGTVNNYSTAPDVLIESECVDKVETTILPECEDLYISTTTKVLYLNQPIDIHSIFWKIDILEYWKPESGVIKKQIKVVSNSKEDVKDYYKKIENIPYCNEHIIKQIDNPDARMIKYKDERKITVGLSRKDIMNYRCKVKNAFYNCFAIVLRFKQHGIFREIHVKVFNTGKMEVPGVLNIGILIIVKEMIYNLISPHVLEPLKYLDSDMEENVLINSNFNCGFYINREKLYNLLRSEKYNLEVSYDPCSYPGVKCKYYFNNETDNNKAQVGGIETMDNNMKLSELDKTKKYSEISFMIFRTGSCLIVGNCTEKKLRCVYKFIKQILQDEYHNIYVINTADEVKKKTEKIRKKTIVFTKDKYDEMNI
jgi:hypothetical protein|tara:strand:+ start:1060 stop:2211 length:1152 start_codon:yes stop_codon:yes gene_type:complete